uniref:Uncharacterized protein n=1 Tax=Rhodothermus marinus TaxID=29549 RepID=A0A7V2F5S6_RHOMR
MVPNVVHRTLGPWWVGGRGWVYEEALTLEDGRVVTRREYERIAAACGGDKRAARELHVELSRLGIRDHYAFASRVLGREVRHLSELTPDERNLIRLEARAQVERTNSLSS